MHSFLEHVPYDVLQHIALLGALPGSAPPVNLCCLLATSRTLYSGLNIRDSPHLYAAIYKLKYEDITPRKPTLCPWTDSALAAELVQRCRALRRCRTLDISVQGLRQDLWTLLGMVVEEGPCIPLSEAAFPNFIVQLALHYLAEDACAPEDIKSLTIWLLCLGFTRQDISSHNPEVRGTLLTLLRRFVAASASSVSHFASPPYQFALSVGANMAVQDPADETITRYNYKIHAPNLPPPSDAAIILIFALKEAVPLQIPYYLPATRAIAIADNHLGPTIEDYTAFWQRAGTVLFSDLRTTAASHRSATLSSVEIDPWIADVLAVRGVPAKRTSYPAGTLTGVWEGSLMISCCISSLGETAQPSDFLCRAPMQCEFSEYFCFSEGTPLPLMLNGRTTRGPRNSEKGFENAAAYHKFTPGEELQHASSRPALDHVLIGQTLRDHEDAWGSGGFNFAGRVHDDGLIVFTRQPKNDEDEICETWVFEGHLRYGTALVGTFRSSSSEDLCGVQGIFSLRKRAEAPMQ